MTQSVGQGGTITLPAVFRLAGTGALVDADPVRVDILNPSNVAVVTDAIPVHDSTGTYHYVYAVPLAAPLGTWTAHWTGVINSSPVAGDDYFDVLLAGSITFTSTILSMTKQILGIDDTDTSQDTTLLGMINDVTVWMRKILHTNFATDVPTTLAFYETRDDGWLQLPDDGVVTQVKVFTSRASTGTILNATSDWTQTGPDRLYLRRSPLPYENIPFWERRTIRYMPLVNARIEVTYTPAGTVPGPVMRAIAITAAALFTNPPDEIGGYDFESIGDYSYKINRKITAIEALAPASARALYAPFIRPLITVV